MIDTARQEKIARSRLVKSECYLKPLSLEHLFGVDLDHWVRYYCLASSTIKLISCRVPRNILFIVEAQSNLGIEAALSYTLRQAEGSVFEAEDFQPDSLTRVRKAGSLV